jgi:hypothetical protein
MDYRREPAGFVEFAHLTEYGDSGCARMKGKYRQGQRQIQRFWLRQNDGFRALRQDDEFGQIFRV